MKFLFVAFTFFFANLSFCQVTGKIFYEEKFDMHRNLPPEREDMKDMIPQYSTSKWELIFSDEESIFKPYVASELTGASANQGNNMMMRFGRENRIIYKNTVEDTVIDSRDFMQKQFLIKGKALSRKWKIGKKHKEVLGYDCMEANFRVDSATTLTAWFTPQIAASTGPSEYQGLPGLILQIDINDGLRTITATEIELDSVDTSVIIIPTKGKVVTSAEFEKLREEKMKEMKLQQGSSGHPMIITRRN